jgi:hypothetical protein
MLVKSAPRTMTLKKARLRKNDEIRKIWHWISLSSDGGP